MPGEAEPEGQVHVLEVAEEALVEPAHLLERLAPVERGRGAGAEDLPGLAPSARRRPTPVASPGEPGDAVRVPGPVEPRRVLGHHLTAREDRVLGVRPRGGEEPLQPLRLGEGVGVEQGDPARVGDEGDTAIGAGGESRVAGQADHLDGPGVRNDVPPRLAGAGVVHDHDRPRPAGLSAERRQAAPDQLPRVPVDDDDGNLLGVDQRAHCLRQDPGQGVIIDDLRIHGSPASQPPRALDLRRRLPEAWPGTAGVSEKRGRPWISH